MLMCVVNGCRNTSKQSILHRFPLDKPVYDIWIERISNIDLNDLEQQIVYRKYRLCHQHFSAHCKLSGVGRRTLRHRSLPTIGMPGFTETPSTSNSILSWDIIQNYLSTQSLLDDKGQFNDITEVQTCWRSLRDGFVRETNWPYFSGLMFLNDVVKLRNSKSNGNGEKALKQQKNYLAASDTSFDCSYNKGSANRPPRKILPKIPAVTTTTTESSLQNASDTSYDIKKRKIDNEDLICKVLESCSERGYEPDECDAFCTRLAASLRRLPYQERAKLEIKFLQDIYDVQESLSLFKDS